MEEAVVISGRRTADTNSFTVLYARPERAVFVCTERTRKVYESSQSVLNSMGRRLIA